MFRKVTSFIVISFIALMGISGQENDSQAQLKITIDSDEINNVSIMGLDHLGWRSEYIRKGENNYGVYNMSGEHADCVMISVPRRRYSIRCYINPTDSLSITINDRTASFNGNGLGARQNNFLIETDALKNKIKNYYSRKRTYLNMQKRGKEFPEPEPVNVEVIYNEIEQLLSEFKMQNADCSPDFIRFMELDNAYFKILNDLNMPSYKVKTYHNFSASDIQLLERSGADSKDMVALLSSNYRDVLSAYIDYCRIHDPNKYLTNGKDYLMNEVNLSKYVQHPLIKDYVVADNLMYIYYANLKNTTFHELAKKYAGSWSDVLLKACHETKPKGEPNATPVDVPDIQGVDVDGNSVSLSDFKGKWVFIDIWATWCGPCNFEMPYSHHLEENLKDLNIEFVGISVDKAEDKEKWIKHIAEKHIGGTQILVSDRLRVNQQFAVQGVPHFAIISPDGAIYLNNAPRPSSGIPERLLRALATD